MIDCKIFKLRTLQILEKLLLVKGMVTQLAVCQIMLILKKIAMDLSKQQALDVDPRATQQINFTANLD